MAWDSTRIVPWKRLIREWLIYVVIAGAAIAIFTAVKGDDFNIGVYAGLLVSGPMYVLVGAALAKLGYQRKTFKELRAETAAAPPRQARGASGQPPGRAKPAPTKRTSTGPSQYRKSSKPKRR
jgi:hypothetical protein